MKKITKIHTRLLLILYFYTIAFLAFARLLRVLFLNGRLADLLPPILTNKYYFLLYIIPLYIIGGIAILLLSAKFRHFQKYLIGSFLTLTFLGSIYINRYNVLYNDGIHRPLIYTISPGSLKELAAYRWDRGFPFNLAFQMHNTYQDAEIIIHPDFPEFYDLKSIQGFGYLFKQSETAPITIDDVQYTEIIDDNTLSYDIYESGSDEFLLFNTEEKTSEILITRYQDKVLFVPYQYILK